MLLLVGGIMNNKVNDLVKNVKKNTGNIITNVEIE